MSKPITILYQDENLVIVDKPANLLSVQTDKGGETTIGDVLAAQLGCSVYPCHRLDRQTSGVMVFAKSHEIKQKVMNQFRKKIVSKTYLAFASGKIMEPAGIITMPIKDKKKKIEMPAKTKFNVVTRTAKYTVVEIKPQTGRTNQIRIHFAQIGHPLLGEEIYAWRKDLPVKFRRVALHAFSINFNHPVTNAKISLSAPLPDDMRELLEEWNVKLNKIYL